MPHPDLLGTDWGRSPRPTRLLHHALAILILSGCASTPLPPWQSQTTTQAARPATPAPVPRARVVPRSTEAPQPVANVPQPAQVTAAPAASTSTALAVDTTGPYSAAVAARFPAPSRQYDTPGLAQDRTSYTTNAELAQWLHALANTPRPQGTKATALTIGRSQQNESLLALIATRATGTDIDSLTSSGRPTVVLMGQQHGDEPASGEALLVIARELIQGTLEPLLDKINVVIVPRANPDGAFAGTRATSNGLDMNRDHLLLRTPEAQALARVIRDYRPVAVIDAHEFSVAGRYLQKFNAIQRYDALLQYATVANYPEFLTKASHEWYYQPLAKALSSQGLSHGWYYTTSANPSDMTLSMGGTQPDTGRNVNGLKNTVSVLIESRGVGIGRTHLQRRMHTQVTALSSALRSTAERASSLEQVRSYVDKEISEQACKGQVLVEAGPTPETREVVFLHPDSGLDMPVRLNWNSSLTLRTVKVRARPCGYLLTDDAQDAVNRLRLLGLRVFKVTEQGSVLAELPQEISRQEAQPIDVRGSRMDSSIVQVQVSFTRSAVDVSPGTFYVPLNQPLAHLAVAALEPDTQSSYFANRILQRPGSAIRVMAPPTLVFEENR